MGLWHIFGILLGGMPVSFFLHDSKYYNTAKHSYKNDAIGNMIGMATLNDF